MPETQTIHLFRAGSSGVVGYTLDPTGSNLPKDAVPGPWERLNTIRVGQKDSPRAGPDIKIVQAAIERDGFYIASEVINVTVAGPRQG